MEEHSVVKKRSVAELAGKFSCPISHMTEAEVNKPVRRRPPRSLPLPSGNDAGQGQDEKGAETASTRKNRNSALIEKLQASLTLSPTGPPPFPKSPGAVKLPVPGSPSSPSSPPAAVTPKQEESPASFESPAEGTVLKSINKGRARHSIKRRPPSRRHRKSSTDEEVDKTALLDQTTPNGHEGDVFEEHKTSADPESFKEQIEQEMKSTDSEKPEPEGKVETTRKREPEEKTEPEDKQEKIEPEDKQEKINPEDKQEKSEDEPQLANRTEETGEEPETQPQTEPDTTDEKEEEQKKDEVNQ
ncbi:LOW QUALITY PROTEIN: duboraya [Puntigrus tetrazona]|uniref:LOW QUALITY PROTEIN: duboraya n=1 Tax=Puntigrus tetrazona TaxID=1606681 RepID=UPI001C8A5F72|nr:LOW QUALITY PROTEIN: duboraya [Puntigrus tetrazona]